MMASFFPPPCPTLADFQSLLVKGSVHASAPVHFSLSYVLQHDVEKAVVLSPSRAQFTVALKDYRDGWITENGGDGRTNKASSKVDILYPPTSAHVTFLLSLFHEALDGKEDFLHPKTTFSTAPSLIVLCELSSFFLGDQDATVSSYLGLISHALSATSALSSQTGKPTALAVFDSGLSDLRLPLVKPPSSIVDPEFQETQTSQPPAVRRESVAYLVERFFEWTATIEENDADPAVVEGRPATTIKICSCRIQRTFQGSEAETKEIIWNWREELAPSNGIVFSWDQN